MICDVYWRVFEVLVGLFLDFIKFRVLRRFELFWKVMKLKIVLGCRENEIREIWKLFGLIGICFINFVIKLIDWLIVFFWLNDVLIKNIMLVGLGL